MRDTDGAGNNYGFTAPATEIQPAFEETLNGFVTMMKAIDEIEEANSNGSVNLDGYKSIVAIVLMLAITLF